MRRVTSCLMTAGLILLAALAGAREDTRSVQVNEDQVQRLNAFVDRLHRLHQQQLQGARSARPNNSGGYARLPEFYREVKLLRRRQRPAAEPHSVGACEPRPHPWHRGLCL